MSSLENIIESLYFSASRPISESEIVKILNDSNYDLKAVKKCNFHFGEKISRK